MTRSVAACCRDAIEIAMGGLHSKESSMAISEPTNADRAEWAKNALAVFTAETYSGDHPDTMHPGDLESAIGDLITDLLHLGACKDMDVSAMYAHALDMFEQERAEEDAAADIADPNTEPTLSAVPGAHPVTTGGCHD